MYAHTIGRPIEILLIEDNLMDARVTINALKTGQVKHRLTLVFDGDEALQFLLRRVPFASAPRPDIVLLDLNLPKRDGLDVLGAIRADEELCDTAVVVLTGSDDQLTKEKCAELRVDGFITKPVNLRKFLDVIRQVKRLLLEDLILPPAR